MAALPQEEVAFDRDEPELAGVERLLELIPCLSYFLIRDFFTRRKSASWYPNRKV